MSGLPITSRASSGNQHVGGGAFSFHRGSGFQGIVKVNEASTQINFYAHGSDISTTSYYRTDDELTNVLPSNGDN